MKMKHDGFRPIAVKFDNDLTLVSLQKKSWKKTFPETVELLIERLQLCLANCNFASHRACHNVTFSRCMLFISKALLIVAKHNQTPVAA
jgi:hypothetical protein